MPASRRELPSMCTTNVEKKLPSCSASPSTLYHLPRGVPVMEGHVEHHAVAGQVAAQGVGRRPADASARVGGGDVDRLLHEGDDREGHRDADEASDGGARQRLVDEVAQYLGAEELQADVAEEQDGGQRDERLLGAQIRHQQADVSPEGHPGL